METAKLKNVERLARIFLILLCLIGGFYKVLSPYGIKAGFVDYYLGEFAKSTYAINPDLIRPMLYGLSFAEILVGVLLIFGKTRVIGLYGYYGFIMLMFFGEYFMDNFHNVNGIPDYLFIGFLCQVLPYHKSLFKSDSKEAVT